MPDSPPTPSDDHTLFGRAVLITEDHPDSREMLATGLRLVGAQVFVVANLKDAQRQLDMYLPSLIICDLRLPDGTGVDLVRWLRARDKKTGGAIPCIAVTGYPVEFPIEGFDGHMRKPLDLAKLCNMAVDLIRLR
jgi:DNA-binding response OmpR family regulator